MKKNTIAAFDFDGTLTKKDSFVEFVKFSKGVWRLTFGVLICFPLLIAMKLKLLSNESVKQKLFSFFYKGESSETFDKWGVEFSEQINKIIHPKMMERLKFHQNNGDKIVIVSASIENWIKPWAKQNGIECVLSTKIEIRKGLITGNFSTPNCYGQEKVNRLLIAFPERKVYKLVAYGDSRGDKEMLEFADCSFGVPK